MRQILAIAALVLLAGCGIQNVIVGDCTPISAREQNDTCPKK